MVLARKLFVAGRGYDAPEPPPPPPDPAPEGVFVITDPPDGAWSWFGDPRAIHHGLHTYIGYVDTSGNVCMRVLSHINWTVGPEIVLHAALDFDDHVNPSFIVRPDGRLLVQWARHEPISTTMHQRVSANTLASDPTIAGGFGPVVNTDAQMGSSSYDYPVPVMLSSEAGRIRTYYRNIPFGSDYQLTQSETTDGGATWSGRDLVYRSNHSLGRGYCKIASDGVSKIHFAVTNDSPNTGTTHLAHFYFDSATGNYHKTDGTVITLRGTAPLDGLWFVDTTPVYTAGNTWVWDIALDGTGKPYIVHPTFPTPFSAHRYHRSHWNGSAWVTKTICDAGAGIDTTGVYSGGVCLDPANPDRVFASRQVSGQWEIFQYVTADGGDSWTETQITSGSAKKNIRPFVVPGAGLLIWLYGDYTGYAAFNMGIRALVLT